MKPLQKSSTVYVYSAVFLGGMLSLGMEILGPRLLAPADGSSIDVWASAIIVTLAALALGYGLGGRWADKISPSSLLTRLLLGSGFAIALVPALKSPVLNVTLPLNLRPAALLDAFCFMGPALFFLGALNPVAARWLLTLKTDIGNRVGSVFALSTLGGILGVLATAFVLIPHFSLTTILYGSSFFIFLFAVAGQLLFGGKPHLLILAIVGAYLIAWWLSIRNVQTPTRGWALLYKTESAYSQIMVVDHRVGAGTQRMLWSNGINYSFINPAKASDWLYAPNMARAHTLRPQAKTALVLGLGGGALAEHLSRRYGLVVDIAEIDPKMLSTAVDYFSFSPTGSIHLEDARRYLETTDRRYDIIFQDTFRGPDIPAHLVTREFFQLVKNHLTAGGLLAINGADYVDGGRDSYVNIYVTLKSVFGHVRAFTNGNVFFFASDSELPISQYPFAELKPQPALLSSAYELTDDFDPAELLFSKTSIAIRRRVQRRRLAAGMRY